MLTLQSRQSVTMRRDLLARIGDRVGADAGFWYGVDSHRTLRQWATWGSSTIDRLLEGMAGRTLPEGAATSDSSAAMHARRGGWTLRWSPPTHSNTFVGWDRHVVLPELQRLPVWNRFYEPAKVHDQIRLLAFSRGQFLGWFGFVTLGSRGFTDKSLAAANRARADVVRGLHAAARVDSIGRDAYAVCRPDGTVEQACSLGRDWLTDERSALMTSMVRDGHEVALVDGAELVSTRLQGADGARYLVTLRGASPMVRIEGESLSPTELAVATSAALGLSVAEVAAERSISANTVKTYLQRVYRKLEVASRVELARALDLNS